MLKNPLFTPFDKLRTGFDKLRANGAGVAIVEDLPFVLSPSTGSGQAQIEVANAYEALFVPALFGQWAPKVVDAARIQLGQTVLAEEQIERILDEAEHVLRPYLYEQGTVECDLSAHIVTGSKS